MANDFIGDPGGGCKGAVKITVADKKGRTYHTHEGDNNALYIKQIGIQHAIYAQFFNGIQAVQSVTAAGNNANVYSALRLSYAPTEFRTKQTEWYSDGGVASMAGMGMFENTNGTNGTYLGLDCSLGFGTFWKDVGPWLEDENQPGGPVTIKPIGSGSFLNDGDCKFFAMGAGWHMANYTANSKNKGFSLHYCDHNLGGGSFEYSNGDTITVEWGVTIN